MCFLILLWSLFSVKVFTVLFSMTHTKIIVPSYSAHVGCINEKYGGILSTVHHLIFTKLFLYKEIFLLQ